MGEKLNRRSKKLLLAFRECQFSDILGVGNILGVDDNQEFDDYLTAIIVRFQEMNNAQQKAMLKMVQDVVKENKVLGPDPELREKLLNPEKTAELAEQLNESVKEATEEKVSNSSTFSTLRGMVK